MGKDINRDNRIITLGGVTYRLSRVVDATATDLHHIVGRMFDHQYNVNIQQNKIRLNRREHMALNQFFKNGQNPREQFRKVFDITKWVLEEHTRRDIAEILGRTDDQFYIPELLKTWKQKKLSKKEKKKLERNSNRLPQKR